MNISRAFCALSFSALATVALSSSALAQDATVARPRSLGVGYAAMLTGADGLSATYDGGAWHADAILGLASNGSSALEFGVRGWFHLHSAAAADFSVGGGLGILNTNTEGPGGETSVIGIDLGLLIRAFITSNVAASAFGGLGIFAGDGDGVVIDGQPVGGLGLTYFF